MKLQPPAWWTVWHSIALQAFSAAFNLYAALTATTTYGAAVSWACVGMMLGTIPMTWLCHGVFKSNQKLLTVAKEQQELIEAIGQAKAEEIGRQIAEHLNEGGDGGVIRLGAPPRITKH
jgi:hypothetical protein